MQVDPARLKGDAEAGSGVVGKGRKGVRMKRFISLIGICAIALVAPLLTGALVAASAMTTTESTASASLKTDAANTTTSAAQTTTVSAARTTTTSAAATTTTTTPTKTATTPAAVSATSVSTTGNGAPSGSHYNLNIIGVPKDKTADMNNNDGHRIFVELNGGSTAASGQNFAVMSKVNTILLAPAPAGAGFQVLDANATDKNGAVFQLPLDVSTTWTVWARALGKLGGKADMTTCATVDVTVTDPTGVTTTTTETVCSLGTTLHLERTKNAKFQNVTSNLLFVTLSATDQALTTCTSATVALFDPCLQNYFWNYDNKGLHLLQLRFYPV
jgi:hypothetical protein